MLGVVAVQDAVPALRYRVIKLSSSEVPRPEVVSPVFLSPETLNEAEKTTVTKEEKPPGISNSKSPRYTIELVKLPTSLTAECK